MAGFLPVSAIYIELHYIFASLWGHKIYTLFGILFLAFIMLIIANGPCVEFYNLRALPHAIM